MGRPKNACYYKRTRMVKKFYKLCGLFIFVLEWDLVQNMKRIYLEVKTSKVNVFGYLSKRIFIKYKSFKLCVIFRFLNKM